MVQVGIVVNQSVSKTTWKADQNAGVPRCFMQIGRIAARSARLFRLCNIRL